jgi:EAL domain-containing protein (putative c-di-GMP-specific phosphodiesterase class I)
MLVDLGVDVLQGYHLSRPLPASEVSAALGMTYAVARPILRIAGTAG